METPGHKVLELRDHGGDHAVGRACRKADGKVDCGSAGVPRVSRLPGIVLIVSYSELTSQQSTMVALLFPPFHR